MKAFVSTEKQTKKFNDLYRKKPPPTLDKKCVGCHATFWKESSFSSLKRLKLCS
jgi:uncharacterized protein with PIN domain